MNTKQTETRRQAAKRIVHDWKDHHFISALNMREGKLVSAIESALKAEAKAQRERAARIIREHRESDKCEGSCWAIITEAIRNGDQDAN